MGGDGHYAKSGDLYIRYEVTGEGPIDLLGLSNGSSVWVDRDDEPHWARFDRRLAELMPRLGSSDLLIVTADHGNDPTTPSTDHAREYVPLLVTGPSVPRGIDLGTRRTFADVGQTLAEVFGLDPLPNGTSFLREIAA